MRLFFIIGMVFSLALSAYSHAQTMTDKLMQKLLDQQMPSVLHRVNNQAFQYGVYDVVVHKVGQTKITSTSTAITNSLPMRIEFLATIKQQIFGQTLSFDCKTQFKTINTWNIIPNLNTGEVAVSMSVPIPDTQLNCEGLSLPVTTVLQKMIRDEKPKWEKEAKQQIEKSLIKVGLGKKRVSK